MRLVVALVVVAMVALAVAPPPARAAQYTLTEPVDGAAPGGNSWSRVGCTAALYWACVATNDGDTSYLWGDGFPQNSGDFFVNWSIDPEDDVHSVRMHAVARMSPPAAWPIGALVDWYVQEDIGGGRACVTVLDAPAPATGAAYADFSVPGGYDETCAESDVHRWEVLLQFDCPACTSVLVVTYVYLEIVVTDRLGFPMSGDSLAWLLYLAIVLGGLLIAAWVVYEWRRRRAVT